MAVTPRSAVLALSIFSAAVLTACGGGGSSAAIGGTINGLASGLSITLQNNGTDTLTMTGNGSNSFTYAFPNTLGSGASYSVSVLTQPLGQTCVIANPTGSVDSNGDNVNSVIVTCSTTSSVAATITGLGSGVGVTLSSNGVSSGLQGNGSYAFPGILTTGATYNVTITAQPGVGSCTIASPTGTVQANKTAVVAVTCG